MAGLRWQEAAVSISRWPVLMASDTLLSHSSPLFSFTFCSAKVIASFGLSGIQITVLPTNITVRGQGVAQAAGKAVILKQIK